MYHATGKSASAGTESQSAHAGHSRIIGLDGLRAIAVMAVFLFHADFAWADGGYLGVDLFFVISGFLITGLLAGETEKNGRLDLGAFYWRRAKRLLPASYLVMTAVIVAAVTIAPDALHRLPGDVISSIFYVTNWQFLFAGSSYFETMGRQPLLLHLWSLAIEEQFYIFWAPVVFLVLPRFGRWALVALAAVLAVASAWWMFSMAQQLGYPDSGADPSRMYFGTDTHGFPLLVGALLGLLWRPNRKEAEPHVVDSIAAWMAGLLALGSTLAMMALMGEQTGWLYPWGFLASAGASAVLILAATYRGSSFGLLLDAQPMRWIGERSYGIYLWHWPIFMLTRPDLDLDLDPATILIIRVVLTFGIAAASYRFIEQPIRHGLFEQIFRDLKSPLRRRWALWRGAMIGLVTGGAVAMGATVLALAPAQYIPDEETAQDQGEEMVSVGIAMMAGAGTTLMPILPPIAGAVVQPQPGPAVEPGPDEPAPAPPGTYKDSDVSAIGDSVMLGSKYLFDKQLPKMELHATVAWQAADVLKELTRLKEAGELRDVVVLHVGTNGYVTEDQFNKILTLLSDRKRVVLINLRAPRRWIDPNNELIDRLMPLYPNVVLADWRAVSAEHKEWFTKDGVHPRPVGQRAYVAEIVRAGDLIVAPPPVKKPPPAAKPAPAPAAAPANPPEHETDATPTPLAKPAATAHNG